MATSSRQHYLLPLPCSLLQLRPIAAKSSRGRSNLASPPLPLASFVSCAAAWICFILFPVILFYISRPLRAHNSWCNFTGWGRALICLKFRSQLRFRFPTPIPDSDSNQPRPRVNCRNGAHEKNNGNLVNLEKDEREQQVGYALLLQPPFPPLFATSSLPPWRAGTDFN